MSKKANPTAIGGFVLGALVLIIGSILLFGGGQFLQQKVKYVTYFPGTVQGLDVGARVEFRGVQVGQVTNIQLDYWPEDARFLVPVQYEIWPNALRAKSDSGGITEEGQDARTSRLVEKFGLRAQLESVSLVTGQYMVALGLHPNTTPKFVGGDKDIDATEIPAIQSTRDKLGSALKGLDLQGLVSKVNDVLDNFDALVSDPRLKGLAGDADALLQSLNAAVDPTVKQLDKTLADYSALAGTAGERVNSIANRIEEAAGAVAKLSNDVDKQVAPISKSATGAFNEARKAFDGIDSMVDERSAMRNNLDTMLEEAAGAARSLRVLADYLEQNPDALIKGKY